MYKELTQKGVNVPNGFAITTNAYKKFLQEANIIDKIEERLKGLNKNDERDLEERGASIRKLILGMIHRSTVMFERRKVSR